MTPTTLDFQIVDFKPEHKQRWKEVNEAWVNEDFVMEEVDHQQCDHPEKYILEPGGHVLVAVLDGEVVGTVGLQKESDTVYEMIKMAVDKKYRGYGIGKRLCIASIDRARELNADVFYLLSNTKAEAAISLYRRLGFKEVPLDHPEWERANIQMEMRFPKD